MSSTVDFAFNLDEYLQRIHYPHTPDEATIEPGLKTLFALHRAHTRVVPFENLDIHLGRGISLDPEALVAKLVRQRRGGYCFEQNALFAMVLRAIGFELTTCEARVRQKDNGVMRARTHMTLRVACEGREWLADVGFGADGLIEPMAWDGTPADQIDATYRLVPEGSLRVLQRRLLQRPAVDARGGWEDLYAIMPEQAYPIDYQVGNWYTSTHPRSGFVTTLTAQRVIGDARHALRNLSYTISRGGEVLTRELTRDELVPLLRGTFDIDVPLDARFLAIDGPR